MIKYFGDRCGKEITENLSEMTDNFCLGDKCAADELTCGFHIGDEIITATGAVGKIIDICTCDRCAVRGFYEPKVDVNIGADVIWVTDNDKDNGFREFYKIGNRVFGNIDKDCVLENIEDTTKEINELQEELEQYKAQLNVVNKIIEKNCRNKESLL